jgi:hypothetical protein
MVKYKLGSNKIMDYLDLRKKYPEFIYQSFNFKTLGKDLVINFKYKINPNIHFNHKIVIKNASMKVSNLDKIVLNNLIFNIGLVDIPSYWKTTCSSTIKIEAGKLDSWQRVWWKKLFSSGMMQYFYENKIDFRDEDFLNIINTDKKENIKPSKAKVSGDKTLIPVGGGKDSVVTLEILNKSFDTGLFIVKPTTPSSLKIAKLSNRKTHLVERTIDPQIIKMNKEGFLNGHVPITASMYFISLLVSYIFGYKYVAFSNERSSSEGNIDYLDHVLNHQYSKTLEFEKDFADYNKKYLSNINIFSLLKPFYEIQIAKLFSRYPKYFSIIRSCNVGQKDGVWCKKCSKCLSTFILFLPFLGLSKTSKMIGNNLLGDKDLSSILDKLINPKQVKPFQCVGTRQELNTILNNYINQNSDNLPILLKKLKTSKSIKKSTLIYIINSFGEDNIPPLFQKMIRKEFNENIRISD